MDDRTAIAWLARRAGFGLAPGQLDQLVAAGLSTTLDRWLDPSAHGVAPAPDPWAGLDLSMGLARGRDAGTQQTGRHRTMAAGHGHHAPPVRGVDALVLARPLRVHPPGGAATGAMLRAQLDMFGQLGLGDFRSLLRAVTVDTAMLIYLNGATNRVGGVNENYAREVLELFALGIGNYSEADVRAGATALTGYAVDLDTGTSAFVPRRHDDTPQTYLGPVRGARRRLGGRRHREPPRLRAVHHR